MSKKIFLVLLWLCCFSSIVKSETDEQSIRLPHFFDDIPNEELALQIVENMSDEELLAQTLMFSWKRQKPGPHIIDWVNTGLGSIKLFGWNTGNSKVLAESILMLQQYATANRFGIPLFIATDQEGGWVRHVKGNTVQTPGNLAIGASGVFYDAYYSGYYISKELRTLGINLNFAPTVDLLTNTDSTIIGTRAFTDDPNLAGPLGVGFMKGSLDAGVLTTAKHFPGHGDTSIDSHGRIPKINISEEVLQNRELVPFKYLIKAGIPAIMTGHLNFPQIMANGEPATFSKKILQDLLRGQLGFKGLIITDDMMMTGALKFAGSFSNAVRLALEAGNNIVEASKTPKKRDPVWIDNLKLLKENKSFRKCVKDSAYKILLTKLQYFKSENYVPIFPNPKEAIINIPDKDGEKFFLSLACRATTIIKNKDIPYCPKNNEKILLVSNYNDFFKYGLKRFPNANTVKLNGAKKYARSHNTIIFCLSDNYSLRILKKIIELYPEKKYIVISVLTPSLLNNLNEVKTAIATYSYSPVSLIAGLAALCGDFMPIGSVPIQLK